MYSKLFIDSISRNQTMNIKDAKSSRYDLMSLGECMVRLSPAGPWPHRIRQPSKSGSAAANTTSPTPWPAWACAPAFSRRLVDNPVGRIILNHGRVGRHGHEPRRRWPSTTASAGPTASGSTSPKSAPASAASVTMYDRGHSAAMQHEAGHDRLQEGLRRAGRPLAAHRRHLRRPLRRHRRRSARKRSSPPRKPARSSATT